MKNSKVIFIHLLLMLVCYACSSSDDELPQPPEGSIDLELINDSQLVEIPLENPTGDEYNGTLNGNPIKLINNHISGLSFWANPNYTIVGETNYVEIPALDMHVNFKVKEVELIRTPDAVLAPVLQLVENEDFSEL